jgi:O-antigen/teichoic acid export membrane protein
LPDASLVRSSGIQFLGNSAARFLGLLFSVVAARLLLPADFGLLTLGMTVAVSVTFLVYSAPRGLSSFLALFRDDRRRQEIHLANWMVVALGALLVNLVVLIPVALLTHLVGWMFVAVAANVLGLAVFVAYREAQRGVGLFGAMAAYYFLANLIQLVAILVAGTIGWRSPAVFLTAYGLAGVAALVIQTVAPVQLRFVLEAVTWHRVRAILGFVRPLILETVFYAVWSGIDVIFVARLLGPVPTGNYGAAKTIVSALALVPLGISVVIGPQVARLTDATLRRYVLGAVTLTTLATIPLAAALILFQKPLIQVAFGDKYPQAAEPLTVLVVGVACYGLYQILGAVWVGLGYPRIVAIASATALIMTIGLGLALVPSIHLLGAALAFTAGSIGELAILGGFTVWALYIEKGQRVQHYAERSLFDS